MAKQVVEAVEALYDDRTENNAALLHDDQVLELDMQLRIDVVQGLEELQVAATDICFSGIGGISNVVFAFTTLREAAETHPSLYAAALGGDLPQHGDANGRLPLRP